MKKISSLLIFSVLTCNLHASIVTFEAAEELETSGILQFGGRAKSRDVNSFNATGRTFKKSFKRAKTEEIYIPADRRHRGLSRFDLLPFTDRRKGDPDRYRAVNPKYVIREDGRYYFVLNAKSGAHFYDENLKDKGVLTDANVRVDLTETRTAKNGDDKIEKYFYVKDKGFVPVSALTETPGEIKAGRWFLFPVKTGEHWLYDGMGTARGTLAADSVKLNYGQKKEIKGEIYYYAFSTKISVGGNKRETIGASGWIKASAIQAGNEPQFDAEFVRKMQIPTAANDTFTAYEIVGGNPREPIGRDESGRTKYRFGYADKNGNFVAYKVLPKVPLDGNQSIAATDYLKRGDDVVNLGFNVAGVSNDTFQISTARPLVFHRSADREATAAIDLFYAKDAEHDGEKIAGKMVFVYGFIDTPAGRRWGWIPLAALKSKS